MKLIKISKVLTAIILLASASSVLAAPPPISDNFDDGDKSAAWGEDMLIGEGTNAVLTETNGHLEFTGSSSEAEDAGVVRPWFAEFGSYTQNWEVAADVNVGAITLPQYSGVEMFIAVVDLDDTELSKHLSAGLALDHDGDQIERGYEMTSAADDTDLTDAPNYGYLSTSNMQSRVRIAFDASTKTLFSSCDGVVIGALDVDDPATSWGMTAASSFVLVLGGSMWGDGTNSSSEVYADNFELRTGNDLTYLLTVNNGTGSGSYTNNASVGITASSAPSAGQVFDHWAGSTQYLTSVTSQTTTVTMPAHAISLAPAYATVGDSSGDDFDDNTKDPAKWGDDVYFSTTNITLQEVNGRVEVLKTAGLDATGVFRPWEESVGSYTQSWETAVDVHLGAISIPPNAWVNINLAVANRADTNLLYGVPMGDSLDIALDLYDDYGDTYRGYEMTSRVNGNELFDVPNYGYVATGDTDGRVKIAFDASTKILTASYNGNVLGSIDVDDSSTDWDMTDSDTFGIAIAGSTGSAELNIAAGNVYADNFEVVGTVTPPEDSDGNGLPDWWEVQYLGGIGADPSALCSNNVDTVLAAYIAGFDPTDPDAFFGITGGDVINKILLWEAVSGRVYSVYWTTNLLNEFQPLETNYTGGAITDTLHGTESKCFYKLDVRLQ